MPIGRNMLDSINVAFYEVISIIEAKDLLNSMHEV
jgi:hypothetical protein